MIDLFFQYLNEYILVRIDGKNILFGNTAYKGQMATIDGLQLSMEGAIKEFPDLKNNINWREEAIKRFKDKIEKLSSEQDISEYIINDLKNYGYIPKLKQRAGFRVEKIKQEE